MQRLTTLGLAIALVALHASCNTDANAGNTEGAEAAPKAPAYALSVVATPETIPVGSEATYRITVAPQGEYVLKTETPFKATLTTGATVSLAKSQFTAADFDDPKAKAKSLTTTFKASAAGKATINADLSFFLCTPQLCERFTANNELAVTVE